MLMGEEAFKDHKVVHLKDEASKAHCPVLSHSGYRTCAKKPIGIGFGVVQLVEGLSTMLEALGSSLITTHTGQ